MSLSADVFSSVFSGLSAIVAAIALGFSAKVHRENLRLQDQIRRQAGEAHSEAIRVNREQEATRSWGEYLSFAMEYPQFSSGFQRDWIDHSNPQNIHKEAERYDWYISRMLMAMEQVLAIAGSDKHWRSAIERQLSYHEAYFQNPRFNYLEDYSQALQDIFVPWQAGRLRSSEDSDDAEDSGGGE
jgi:hypothetical protein